MNLLERLERLEAHSGEFHEYINRVVFGWVNYFEAAKTVDDRFKEIYKHWVEHHDAASKIGANFLLQTMAIMNTRFYRKLNSDLERLAGELDIPDYSPEPFIDLVKNKDLLPNRFKRLKSRVYRGLREVNHLKKSDERYSTLADYLWHLGTVLSKE